MNEAPMNPMDDTATDDQSDQDQDTLVICIEVKADGTFMVGPESEDGSDDDANMQPARSVDEALAIAKKLLSSPSPEQDQQAQDDFAGGFQSVVGTPAPAKGPAINSRGM